MKFSCYKNRLERKTVKRKRVFATLKVIGTVLEQLAKEVSPEEAQGLISEELKRMMESDAAMTEDLIAYNIIPLDAPVVTNVITSFPEVNSNTEYHFIFFILSVQLLLYYLYSYSRFHIFFT